MIFVCCWCGVVKNFNLRNWGYLSGRLRRLIGLRDSRVDRVCDDCLDSIFDYVWEVVWKWGLIKRG